MGLKFRRGSTAQQSGSLAFGEPYVNTTLGTLIVGGATGDIILSSTGTGSTGNFGAISGSGLDITGNANVAGNLTLGGKLTIGDASSDTVNVVASLSSSLIPSVTNAFDLGSENYFWRDLYISTGSIKFVGAAGTVVGTLSNAANGMVLDAGIVTNGNSSFGTSSLAVTSVTGSLRVSGSLNVIGGINGVINATNGVVSGSSQIASDISASLSAAHLNSKVVGIVSGSSQIASDISASLSAAHLNSKVAGIVSGSSQVIGILDSLNTFSGSTLTRLTALEVETTNLESFTSSINTTIKSKLDADGVISGSSQILGGSGLVSGSSQITLSSTTGFSAYSTSVDSRITTEKGRVDAILSAADADKDTFAEIVTLINSVDLSNDTSFASFYTASVGRLNNLETTSGSVNISVSNLNTFSGSALTRLSALEVETSNLESFTSSINTTIKNRLDANTVVSGSSQVIGILSSLNTYTGSNDTTNTTQNSRLDQLSTASGSAITRLSALEVETANLETFSSSALTRLSDLEGKDFSITLTGDVTGTGTVTNLSNVSFATTVAANSVALGTDTTGDYVASLVAGTNITLSNNSGEGATPTIGLTNSSTTIGTTAIALGASSTTLAGLTSVSSTAFTGALTGNASTATTLATARAINGVNFDGSAAITITAAAGTLSGATLASGVTASSLTSVGTLTTLTVSGATATGALTVTGAITATGDITAFYTSDKRHKNNIQTIPNALEKVTKLNGVTWEWNDDVNEVTKSTPKTGLIAQEVQEVLPEVVKTRDDGFLALDYSKMMGLLVEAIKEQQVQIEELKAQIGSK